MVGTERKKEHERSKHWTSEHTRVLYSLGRAATLLACVGTTQPCVHPLQPDRLVCGVHRQRFADHEEIR